MNTDKYGRPVCGCGGYHFPHRKGSGACHSSPRAEYYAAVRANDPEALALLWADKIPPVSADPVPEDPVLDAHLDTFLKGIV